MSSSPPTTLPPLNSSNLGQNAATLNSGGINFGLGGGTTGAPSASNSTNVLISPDQSSLSQYVIGQVGGYPVTIGGNLGGGLGGGSTTIGAALNDFYELSPAQLVQLETMLWDGGFYVNGDGSPMTTAPAFGSYDSQSWTAFARALETAASSNTPLMTIIQNNINSGAGAAAHATLPTPVLGGANNYQIDLTNPADVLYTANQIFQATDGRNATQAEVNAITAAVNSQTIAQGYQQEAGKEQQSQAQYKAQQTQRNTQYAFQTTPKLALGAVPNGPFQTDSQWAAALLGYMGLPVTASNIAFMASLAGQLGGVGGQNMNPLNVVTPQGGSQATSTGAQKFQTWSQSLQSTAEQLLNGKYQPLIQALESGNPQNVPGLSQALGVLSDGKVTSVKPSGAQAQDAANVAATVARQTGQQTPGQASTNTGLTGKQASLAQGQPGGTGLPPAPTQTQTPGVTLQPGQTMQQAEQATLQAGAANPQVGTYLRAQAAAGTNPAQLNPSQQPPNPGDQYINPNTTITTNPASASAAAYQEATTGANTIPYLWNQYLNAYQAVVSMIKGGGFTG